MTNNQLKLAALQFSEQLGLFTLVSRLTANSGRILMYHRFAKVSEKGKVEKKLFEKHIAFLKEKYEILDLHDYIGLLRGDAKGLRNTAVLTIDDGYRDFYEFAYPVLRKYSVPATVFLPRDFIDGKIWLWHDTIDYALKNRSARYLNLYVRGDDYRFDLEADERVEKAKRQLYSMCTSVGNRERKLIIQTVIKKLNIDLPEKVTPDYAPLTRDQIREMSEFGISFGAHSCSHPILSKLNFKQVVKEIYESKKYIENLIEKPITAFCYPNGKRGDFNADTKRILGKWGFTCAVTAIYGMNNRFTDPHELKRIGVGDSPYIYFLQDISGFGVFKAKLYNFLRMRNARDLK